MTVDPHAIRDAILPVMESHMITTWLVLAEVIDMESGERELVQCVPEDLPQWTANGMLWTSLHDEVEE